MEIMLLGKRTKTARTLNTLSFEVVPQGCRICFAPEFHHLVTSTKEMLHAVTHSMSEHSRYNSNQPGPPENNLSQKSACEPTS